MKTAVLGAGKMGVWYAKFCKEKGDHVVLADRKKERIAKLDKELGIETTTDFTKAVEAADNVILCVSISSFEETVKKIGSAIRDGQYVMDICSIKEFPVKIMHEYIKHGTILGTHPVFGPGSQGVKHKAYILTPTNPAEEKFAVEFKKWLENEKAHVFVMSPQKHDQLMSVVLGLPHFLGLVACETILEQKNFCETKQVAGTTYRMLFTLAEATALETPDLFANLQMNLPQMGKIEAAYIAKAQEWLDLIRAKNPQAIVERMEQLKTKLCKIDPDFAESYKVMYKMLEATEK